MITISYSKLKKYAYIALALPFLVFALGWLKWYWAVVAITATLACVYLGSAIHKKNDDKKKVILETECQIEVKPVLIALVVMIALIWVWQSGIGGFWAQSKDYPWRNAIYRDIVLRDWPVYYQVFDGALVYYIGFWLVPALFGKIALLCGANDVMAFQVASVAIFIWFVLLIIILFFLLITLLKADTLKRQMFVILGFIFFSGMDILGSIEPLGANMYHLEWWANDYQYSSFTTCLFWVFNQCVPAWMAFVCLLQESNVRNYVFLGMMCMFSGPLPFIGFFILCIGMGIVKGIKAFRDKKGGAFLKDIVSPSNLLATAFVFVFIATYLLSNEAISGGGALRVDEAAAITQGAVADETVGIDWASVGNYAMFIMFEFGIYALLIARKYYKEPLFYVMVGSLLVFPFLKIGNGSDFPMRASIPAIVFLYYLVMKFVIEEKHWLKQKGTTNRMLYLILIVMLCLGSITPAVEFYRGCRQVVIHGLDNPMEDYLYTLGGDAQTGWDAQTGYEYSNFVSVDPQQEFFFRYFSRELK